MKFLWRKRKVQKELGWGLRLCIPVEIGEHRADGENLPLG